MPSTEIFPAHCQPRQPWLLLTDTATTYFSICFDASHKYLLEDTHTIEELDQRRRMPSSSFTASLLTAFSHVTITENDYLLFHYICHHIYTPAQPAARAF